MRIRSIVRITFGLAMTVLVSGCSVIDEDLSDCDEALMLDYDLHLITNQSIELQKEFDRQADANLLKALRNYLAPISRSTMCRAMPPFCTRNSTR